MPCSYWSFCMKPVLSVQYLYHCLAKKLQPRAVSSCAKHSLVQYIWSASPKRLFSLQRTEGVKRQLERESEEIDAPFTELATRRAMLCIRPWASFRGSFCLILLLIKCNKDINSNPSLHPKKNRLSRTINMIAWDISWSL